MCCADTDTLDLPPAVIEMLAHYRQLQTRRGWDWGDDQVDMFRWARFSQLGDVFSAVEQTGDWPTAVRSVIGDQPGAGIVVISVAVDGALAAQCGSARMAIPGRSTPIDVVIDSASNRQLDVVVAGARTTVAESGTAIATIEVDSTAFTVTVGEHTIEVTGAVTEVPAASLRLRAPWCARWSVTDASGGAWFPDGAVAKWDVHDRPFFHADDVLVAVPAEDLHVSCTRGVEYDVVEHDVSPTTDEKLLVECAPPHLFDPSADGWWGADLHVHLNYSGDLVCTPANAARMQLGEGLHLLNLTAGNCQTSFVYDRQLVESFAGVDLDWTGHWITAVGVEYRNDLLGHVHALGPSAAPSRWYSGHERSDHPDDWPPNAVACRELQDLGATVGYAHPAMSSFGDDWSTDRFFATPRSVEARELVADAALGVVDSVDLISPMDNDGAVFLYHRLLSCGLRLAATAGTDAFLSFAHGPGVASNPPGWGRVYAHLGDTPLSTDAVKDAIRAGRTTVTNGPWITLDVDGHGPGTELDHHPGDPTTAIARVHGPGADRLLLVGPDGVLAENDAQGDLHLDLKIDQPLWIAAVARGPANLRVLDASVLAHTTPVYINVDGQHVARARDAQWCLDLLDTLNEFVAEHGNYTPATRTDRLGDVHRTVNEARRYYQDVLARTTTRAN